MVLRFALSADTRSARDHGLIDRNTTMNALIKNPQRLAVLLVACCMAATLPAGDSPPKAGGPGKPLSPQEAQKLFRLDEGLRIELVAAEPTIQSPVAMTFDPQGRIWVVEMQDYPNGPAKGEKPRGRIRILEDKDGDGYYESATTFADNLLFANGLLLWKDGAIVTMAPNIVHLRDTDGDGKADKKDVLYEGFAAQNPQLRVSHPILGLDGWVYCANGLRGGKVIRSPLSPLGRGAGGEGEKPLDLSGMDFKFDPITGAYEAITGLGQYGNTFDEWGNRFVCDNRHHLRHIVMENRYLKRNPYLAAPALVEDISVLEDGPLSSGGKVYPLSRNWTTSSLHEGRFTAACGVFIYHGELLGKAYHGAAFTCEPTGNLVHMEVLTPKGATFTAKPPKQGVEFLATPDDWFRPVFLTHGPDGAMYLIDMYRAVIEHPDFMPPELQKRPDLTLGRDKGRIWRIVPKNHVTKAIRPNLAKASIEELVKTLEHPEPWWRTTAERLIRERVDQTGVKALRTLFDKTQKPYARVHAAYLLQTLGALDEACLLRMLKDEHPRVREHGLWLLPEDRRSIPVINRQEQMVDDPDGRVRFALALVLGDWPFPDTLPMLAKLASADCEDRWMRLAVASAAPSKATPVVLRLLDPSKSSASPARQLLIRELASIIGARKDPGNTLKLIVIAARPGVRMAPDHLAAIVGLADGLERRGATLISVGAELTASKKDLELWPKDVDHIVNAARIIAGDAKAQTAHRLMAIRVASQGTWPTARAILLPLLNEAPELEIRLAALRSIAAHGDREVPALLLKLWPSASPPVRREILEAMLRRPERIGLLLDEIDAKRVKASELDAVRTRQLVQHADPKIRERAKKLLQENLPADRQAALTQYRAALDLKGDAKRGQEIFKKNCATCHRVAGIGTDVGPDIADTRTKTLPALLTDIILPNQAIDNNYINYLVSTKDGRVLTGILAAETATSVTLKRAEGQTDVVLRKDIEDITSTGVSLMPDGLEKNISVPEMADLLRFLKDWRYLDGSVPVGP
jgi:putative membrane-bound dehydrogenase-like protein